MDRIEEDALKRHERPRRQLNSHFLPKPLKQGDGPGHGEGAGGKKYHANGSLPLPSWVVLSTILNVLAEKQKLKIDCNFQFLDFVENRKTKPCHRLRHRRKSKIAAQFHFSLYC